MRNWGLNHKSFSLPVSGFISSAAELRLQLKLRMWYQTAFLHGQIRIIGGGNFSVAWSLFSGKAQRATHILYLQQTHLTVTSLALKYPVVQRLRLDIWSFDHMGEGKTKPAPNSDKLLMSKEYFLMLSTQKNDGRKQGGSFFLQKPFCIWHFWQMP